jgi:hypothetical protein
MTLRRRTVLESAKSAMSLSQSGFIDLQWPHLRGKGTALVSTKVAAGPRFASTARCRTPAAGSCNTLRHSSTPVWHAAVYIAAE